ncbi:MAG: ribonuclease J, partial [Phascolarctobacterium sp.]|nr:ribonuclease J [Phascolarctobacterium sp.]
MRLGGVFFLGKIQNKVQIIPLGGLGEIGKNMTVFRYGDDIILIDAGLMFPEDDMLGIDLVIPDITYLIDNKDKVKAIFLTHGHEDHIGALPYVMKQLEVPVYGNALTLGILQGRLRENGVSDENLVTIKPGDKIGAGAFNLEFIRVNHSIPDAVSIVIKTPIGTIIHTGDFKFDQTPVDGQVTQFNKFAEFGDAGVLALLADSTNAERPGFTQSEKMVGQTFDDEFRYARNRIIVATFSSNVHRIQQVVDSAVKYKRKVAVIGRSMINVVNIAMELGYLNIPEGVLIDIDETNNYTADQIVIITTGSQGEPMSALTRMAMNDHKKVGIMPGDTVIISATPIPGNEKLVSRTINHLYKLGAEVIYEKSNGVHVSGHASQEEIKLMHNLVRPKYFIPVHGEYRHLIKHANIAKDLGMPKENIVIAENGSVIELSKEGINVVGKIQSGKVLVDGLGVGDVGNIVLRDRRLLSQDGIMIVVVTIDHETYQVVSGPDIVS